MFNDLKSFAYITNNICFHYIKENDKFRTFDVSGVQGGNNVVYISNEFINKGTTFQNFVGVVFLVLVSICLLPIG